MKFYKGMKIIQGRNYESVYFPEHHLAQSDGTVNIHLLIAEDILGRPLNKDMVVHHIDFNKKNNDVKNIMIFKNQSSHMIFHICLKYKYDYSLTCIDGVYSCVRLTKTKRESSNKRVARVFMCPVCGNKKNRDNRICINCYNKQKSNNSKCPSKNELQELLYEHKNFCKIGEIFGVTDNAIRKWCKKYGLPYKTSDLR